MSDDTAFTYAVSTADLEIVRLITAQKLCWNPEFMQQAKAQAQDWGLLAIAEALEAVEGSSTD